MSLTRAGPSLLLQIHVLPRKPRARPMLLPGAPLFDVVDGALNRLVLPELGAGVEADETLAPLDTPRPRPRVVVVVLVGRVAASARFLSSSSAFRAAAAFLSCSSASRLSAAYCLACASSSMSAISWLAPCHDGSRISLWLCSVCDNTRVQVFSSCEAALTVPLTV